MTDKIVTEKHSMLIPVMRVSKDAARMILRGEIPEIDSAAGPIGVSNSSTARQLVDLYYSFQDLRKATENKDRAVDQGADPAESDEGIDFMMVQVRWMEANAKTFLEVYRNAHEMGPWFNTVPGIGPVLSAGLLAHLGARPIPPTVGHWWRYAGLDPTQQWLGQDQLKRLYDETPGDDLEMRVRAMAHTVGRDPETVLRDATTNFKTGEVSKLTKTKALKSLARIPFNRPLKTLCWKVGDQMVKLGNKEDAFYAKFYRDRKAQEIARNERGDRANLAAKTLREKPNHAQADIYKQGKLPDGRIDLMARRATVKLFLSHLHELWYEKQNGQKPPHPFSTTIKGHAHYIKPPYRHALFDD